MTKAKEIYTRAAIQAVCNNLLAEISKGATVADLKAILEDLLWYAQGAKKQ